MNDDKSPSDRDRSGNSTSRSLLADARLSLPAAWERLVRLYAPLVASWCRRWGAREQDLVDILQEVFLSVAANLDRFRKERPTDTFRGWLFTISRNKFRDHLRNSTGEPAAVGGSDGVHRMQQILDPHADREWTDATEDALVDELLKSALESIRC